jgi:Fur family ferric uptake transcriptional regulator
MNANIKKFEDYVNERGLKSTAERRVILDEIISVSDHFEADDLLICLRQKGSRVSKGTIYRTLNLLLEAGLIRQVAFIDKHAHYEHIYGHKHHEHLICTSCGKIINFYRQPLEKALEDVCLENDFVIRSHNIEVLGLCKVCSKVRKEI